FSLTSSSLSDNKFKVAYTCWWIVWATIHIMVLTSYGFTTSAAIVDSITCNIFLAGCCLLINHNMRFYLPRQERYWYVLIISLGLTAVWLFVVKFFLSWFLNADDIYLSMLRKTSFIR